MALGWVAGLLEEEEGKGKEKGGGRRESSGHDGSNNEEIYEEDMYEDAREDVLVEEGKSISGDKRVPVVGGWVDDVVVLKDEDKDEGCIWGGCDD